MLDGSEHQITNVLAAEGSCAFEGGLDVGLKRSEATAILESQAERPARA
jgi:hypothetical protein